MPHLSHFFAYINRLRWIRRWSLMRNAIPEDVATHSWEVATIAHVLAVIHNQQNETKIDAHRMATIALYHDATEVITGDMPTPVKYHSESIQQAYKGVERKAQDELLALLPPEMQEEFRGLLIEETLPDTYRKLLKAADRISALLKCRAELRAGNKEFEHAEKEISKRLLDMQQPEVDYFLNVFAPGYELSLDHLLGRGR
jgi:5'-deoxynucleotidase